MIGITINMIMFEIFVLTCCTAIGTGLSGKFKQGLVVGILTDIVMHLIGFGIALLATFGDTVIL